MTLADTFADLEMLVGTALEHLDMLDVDMAFTEANGDHPDTIHRMQDDLASVRRAVAAIRMEIRTADDTPQAAEQAVPS